MTIFNVYETLHLPLLYVFFFSHVIVFSIFRRVQVSIFISYDWIMNDFMKHFQRPFI